MPMATVVDYSPSLPFATSVAVFYLFRDLEGGSVAEWLACLTQAQKGLGSNRSHDAVG